MQVKDGSRLESCWLFVNVQIELNKNRIIRNTKLMAFVNSQMF